jgi:acyl-CoA thioesterase I
MIWNPFRNDAGGQKDKPDGVFISRRVLRGEAARVAGGTVLATAGAGLSGVGGRSCKGPRMKLGAWISMLTVALVFVRGAQGQGQGLGQEHVPEPPTRDCQTPGATVPGSKSLTRVRRAIKDRKVLKILSIGASSSGGEQEPASGYSDLIETLLEKSVPGVDVRIIDRGISGELVTEVARRLPAEVALNEPDIVLWQLGTADALARMPEAEFAASVADTLRWLEDHDVDVALVGPMYARSVRTARYYQAIRAALKRVAETMNVLLVRRYDAMQIIEQARKSSQDGLPNEFALADFGYTCLAEYVVRAVTAGIITKPEKGRPPAGQ